MHALVLGTDWHRRQCVMAEMNGENMGWAPAIDARPNIISAAGNLHAHMPVVLLTLLPYASLTIVYYSAVEWCQ